MCSSDLDLTFDVVPGRVTGFLGPNGAGKSTTMRLILGLDTPNSGAVTVEGRAYRSIRRPLHVVGSVLESSAIHPGRSARAHLLALARSNGIPARRIDEVLADVGLSEVSEQRVGGFSLGMSQRLGMAAALLGDPSVLLLDEPVNGLDPEGVAWIRHLLRSLADDGRTVFLSSHLMSEMENTADHVVVIGQGKLVADEPLVDFTRKARSTAVFVRAFESDRLAQALTDAGGSVRTNDQSLTVDGLSADEVGMVANRQRIALRELHTSKASLEEAFIHMTRDTADFQSPERDVSS